MKKEIYLFFCVALVFLMIDGNSWAFTPQISVGENHTIVIGSDGKLWAWGDNELGQLGDGTTTNRAFPVQIGIENNWISISTGSIHTVALKTDGSLWAWGLNQWGQLGNGTYNNSSSPVQIGNDTNWISVSAGETHTIAQKSDGTVWGWGSNVLGQIGDGTNTDSNIPVQVGNDTDWISISSGNIHTMALKSDGTLWAWGNNDSGQLGDGTIISKISPVRIGSGNNWISVSAGELHTIAQKSDGTVWGWGLNIYGQIGNGTNTDSNFPVQVGSDTDWISISAGNMHTMALKSDGTLWAWGDNVNGQFGDGTITNRNIPVQVGNDNSWILILAGNMHTVALKSDGVLWAWGLNTYGQIGDGTTINRTFPVLIGSDTAWIQINGGWSHTIALKSNGTLWACGNNELGQLGDGTTTNRTSPVQVGSDNNWVLISLGYYYSMALKSDGTLWAWGWNNYSQLGDGTTTNRTSPVQIGSDNNWVSISLGNYHSMALKSDGTLWAWGWNNYSQLGDGTTTNRTSPVQIGSDNNWISISLGNYHSMALKSDGTLWAWGDNKLGQLGDGTTINRASPVQVGSDNNWVSISLGYYHSMALKSDGTLWAWGWNNYCQLGDGTTINRASPVQIGSDNNWASISLGYYHSMALKSDGTLWAWGASNSGLGNGTNTYLYSPVQIGSDTDWVSINCGWAHTIALKSSGVLMAWGWNQSGQLGDGTVIDKNFPELSNIIPTVTLEATPATGNASLTVTLTGTGQDIDGYINRVELDFEGDGTYDIYFDSGSVNYTYNTAGKYNPRIKVTDNDGAAAEASIVISVNDLPTVALAVNPASGNVPLTVGFTANASDSDGSIISYEWDFNGDGSYDTTTLVNTVSYIYNTEGTYTAKIKVTDNDGATAEGIANINVLLLNAENVITIDYDSGIAAINKNIFGNNILAYDPSTCEDDSTLIYYNYMDYGAGIWDPALKKSVSEVVDLAKTAGLSIMRFPGGCGTHHYDWKSAIGDEREHFLYGLDEYLETCEDIGAEPVITISYFTGDESDAADLVEYLNQPNDSTNPNGGIDWALERTKNGHSGPYNVKYFEIGNEVWHGDHRNINNVSSVNYAQKYLKYYEAMKGVDSQIKIGALFVDIPGPNNWNSEVLGIINDKLDFGIYHNYPTVANEEELDTMNVKYIYELVFALPSLIHDKVDFPNLLKLLKEKSGKEVPLAVTEYNGGLVAKNQELLYRHSLGTALLNAEMLSVFIKPENNILMANSWQFVNSYFGMILNNNNDLYAGYNKRPNYYVYDFYNNHFGDVLLDIDIKSKMYDLSVYSELNKLSQEYTDVLESENYLSPYLSVTASKNNNGDKIYLMVINKNMEDSMATTIKLNNFISDKNANIWILNGPSVDATNEEDPSNVKVTQNELIFEGNEFQFNFAPHSLTAIEIKLIKE